MIVSFGELAKAIGKSEPTLRKLLDDHDDWPVEETGTNGVAYKFDLKKSIGFYQSLKQREADAEIARQADIKQISLDLLGDDAATANRDITLTAKDRKDLMEEEMAAMKLGIARGEYVRKDSIEEAFSAVLVWFGEKGKSFSARLARRHDIPRDLITAIDEQMEADQHELSERMSKAGDMQRATGENQTDTAM